MAGLEPPSGGALLSDPKQISADLLLGQLIRGRIRRSKTAQPLRPTDIYGSESLGVGTKVNLLRPDGTMLRVQIPVAFGDRIGIKQSVRTLSLCDIGNYGEYFVTFDGAVYDGVRHVDAPWPELSSERLAHHPQARLRSGLDRFD
jgi:hypothetical protein